MRDTQIENAPTVRFQTLGCKVNRYDTEAMADALWRAGFRPAPDGLKPDVVIVNTCAVTGRGESKSRQAVRKAARDFPDAAIVVAGCLPQLAGCQDTGLPVQGVVGTSNRAAIADVVRDALALRVHSAPGAAAAGGRAGVVGAKEERRESRADGLAAPAFAAAPRFEEMPVETFAGRTRATVKIQEGCEQFCSYCIIPYARGPSRSREPDKVIAELGRLVARGFREVVLTGIHLGFYGRDLTPPLNLTALLRRCLAVEGLDRIRLSSIEVTEVDAELTGLMGSEPRLCPHLHLPLQSGSDPILKAMNRPYTTHQFLDVVDAARASIPDLAVTTDIIVGFPGEGPEEFAQTINFVRRAGFSRLHVFPYSRRAGTPAAGFPHQIPAAERARRAAELIAVGRQQALAYHQGLIGQAVQVLVEGGAGRPAEDGEETDRPGDGAEGLTGNYVRVMFPASHPAALVNRLVLVRVDRAEHWGVWAHPIDTD